MMVDDGVFTVLLETKIPSCFPAVVWGTRSGSSLTDAGLRAACWAWEPSWRQPACLLGYIRTSHEQERTIDPIGCTPLFIASCGIWNGPSREDLWNARQASKQW